MVNTDTGYFEAHGRTPLWFETTKAKREEKQKLKKSKQNNDSIEREQIN